MKFTITGEEIPQGVPVFHSGYGGADHSAPVSGDRDSVVVDRGVVTTAHVLARGKRAAASCSLHKTRAAADFRLTPGMTAAQSIATAHGEIWPERKPRIAVPYLSVPYLSLRTAHAEEP
jgi:hypothetical protein